MKTIHKFQVKAQRNRTKQKTVFEALAISLPVATGLSCPGDTKMEIKLSKASSRQKEAGTVSQRESQRQQPQEGRDQQSQPWETNPLCRCVCKAEEPKQKSESRV